MTNQNKIRECDSIKIDGIEYTPAELKTLTKDVRNAVRHARCVGFSKTVSGERFLKSARIDKDK